MRSVNLKIITVVLFALAMVFTACGETSKGTNLPEQEEVSDNSAKESKKNPAEEQEDESIEKDEEKATITFTVVDAITKEPLDSAIVSRAIDIDKDNFQSKRTNLAGISVWKKLGVGEYDFYFGQEGYASKQRTIKVEEGVTNLQSRVDLHPLGVEIKGRILYEVDETGKVFAADGVIIYAKHEDDEMLPNEYVTKTDMNGEYTIINLAEGVEVSVYVDSFTKNGITYEQTPIGNVNERRLQDEYIAKDMGTTVVHAVGADIPSSSSGNSGETDVCGSKPAAGCNFEKEDNVWKFLYAGTNYIEIYTWVDETTVEYKECLNSYHMDRNDLTYTDANRDEMFAQAMEDCSVSSP